MDLGVGCPSGSGYWIIAFKKRYRIQQGKYGSSMSSREWAKSTSQMQWQMRDSTNHDEISIPRYIPDDHWSVMMQQEVE